MRSPRLTGTYEARDQGMTGKGRGAGTHRTAMKTGVYTLVAQVCRLSDTRVHEVTVKSVYHKRGRTYGYIKDAGRKVRVVRIMGSAWEIL